MAHLVGLLSYNAHAATPTVIGDFEQMKAWPGDPDGEAEGVLEVGEGQAFGFTAFDLASPYVFVEDSGRVTLLVEEGSYGRTVDAPTGEPLKRLLDDPCEADGDEAELECASGALVVTVAYNATPEVGADTSGLDEACFHDDVPRLPKAAPQTHTYLEECAILRVPEGTYRVETGGLRGYERCQLTPL